MPYKSEIAHKIKSRRKLLSLTQSDLANKIGLSRAAISQFESGDSNPSVDTLVKIANALDIQLTDLVSSTNQEVSGAKQDATNNVQAVGFLADMMAVDLPFVSFRARASFIELGMGVQHPENFETLRLYVNSEEDATRYTGALVFEVEGDSMEPLLRTGEKVIAW